MDPLTHALIGATIGELSPKRIKNRRLKGAVAGMIPDLFNLLTYFYLGIKAGHNIPIAKPEDYYSNTWIIDHWTWMPWEITHSFLFWAIVIVPITLYFKQPILIVIAYFSHLILDLPSHTGIWSSKPFYPFNYQFEGWFDAWAWDFETIISFATIPLIIWLICAYLRENDYWFLRWPSEENFSQGNKNNVTLNE